MSTMQQQAPPAEAVEEQMGKIVTELGAALGVLLTSLGTRSGLWAALAGAGPLTTAEVAANVSVEPSLVREWLRAQAAGGYLDYDPATGTFALPAELIAAAIGAMAGVATVLAAGGSVADVGCGYGTPTMAIAGLFSAARVLGIDYHDASIAHSRAEAARRGAGNVRFEVAAASGLPGQGYDLITFFDSLHDIGDPLGALTRARDAIAPS